MGEWPCQHRHLPLDFVDASDEFLSRLSGVTDPEEKRKVIGATFIDVFEQRAHELGHFDFLAQGPLYPDVIESGAAPDGPAATIKLHHNVRVNENLKNVQKILDLSRQTFDATIAEYRALRAIDLDEPIDLATEINLHLPTLLPTAYCEDVHERLVIYKRLANGEKNEDIDAIQEELVDRFGELPPAVRVLIECHRLRLRSRPWPPRPNLRFRGCGNPVGTCWPWGRPGR